MPKKVYPGMYDTAPVPTTAPAPGYTLYLTLAWLFHIGGAYVMIAADGW